MLDLGEAELERIPLLAGHEPELARHPLAGLLRQISQTLGDRAQLRPQLVDELTERERAVATGLGHRR